MDTLRTDSIREYVANKHGIVVKKCCASCSYKREGKVLKTRYCKKWDMEVKPKDFCRRWHMSRLMRSVGQRRPTPKSDQ